MPAPKTHRRKVPRVRGYRIRISLPGRPSVDLPLIWSQEPPAEAWERVKRDPSIVRAVMLRSGSPFQHFTR